MTSLKVFVSFILIVASCEAAKKHIHSSVKICKRNDPEISNCFKQNFERLLPLMKNGIPEMNIVPIDPILVEKVRMDFPQTQSIKLTADLTNAKMWGISGAIANEIIVARSTDGDKDVLTMYLDLTIPKVSIESDYRAVGKFLLLYIDSVGNFTGNFEGLHVKTNWTSTPFTKKERQHLAWTNELKELSIKKLQIRFNNLFGNNTELTENTNNVINENINELYDEISPVVKETINTVALNAVNNVYSLFPLDVLFPK